MSRKREKKKVVVRVPNPDAPVKERLRTPSHKVHRSKKGYRRREKQDHQRDRNRVAAQQVHSQIPRMSGRMETTGQRPRTR